MAWDNDPFEDAKPLLGLADGKEQPTQVSTDVLDQVA